MHGIVWAVSSRLRAVAFYFGLSMLLLAAGCIVADGDATCGPNQAAVSGAGSHYCLCAPGFVIDDDAVGCKACGENEEGKHDECVCKAGYVRSSGTCAESSLGAVCESSTDCSGDFSTCVMDQAGGYCSSAGCTSSNDCQPSWFCSGKASDAVCKKPPDGYQKPCAGAADCAGTSATYCDSFQTHSCVIEGCGAGVPCPGDWSCCNISLIGVSLCIPPSGLAQGACPAGGTLVAP